MGGDFGAIFWKKAWAIVQGIFQKMTHFLKMAITFFKMAISYGHFKNGTFSEKYAVL